MSLSGKLERLLLIVGISLLAIYVVARIHGAVLARAEVDRFISEPVAAPVEYQLKPNYPKQSPMKAYGPQNASRTTSRAWRSSFRPQLPSFAFPRSMSKFRCSKEQTT